MGKKALGSFLETKGPDLQDSEVCAASSENQGKQETTLAMNERAVVLDTETTGLSPADGHRVVEIGCLELVNHLASGRNFQQYINPERDMPEKAEQIHGLSETFLKSFPVFGDVVVDFLEFIGNSPLIIHNADFDLRFLNAELKWLDRSPLTNPVIDTLALAKRKYPGAQASLDALCRRFGIDNSNRAYHGALLDSELLAEVYLELIGGREPSLDLTDKHPTTQKSTMKSPKILRAGQRRNPRPHSPSPEEIVAHQKMVKTLKNPIWLRLEET